MLYATAIFGRINAQYVSISPRELTTMYRGIWVTWVENISAATITAKKALEPGG